MSKAVSSTCLLYSYSRLILCRCGFSTQSIAYSLLHDRLKRWRWCPRSSAAGDIGKAQYWLWCYEWRLCWHDEVWHHRPDESEFFLLQLMLFLVYSVSFADIFFCATNYTLVWLGKFFLRFPHVYGVTFWTRWNSCESPVFSIIYELLAFRHA